MVRGNYGPSEGPRAGDQHSGGRRHQAAEGHGDPHASANTHMPMPNAKAPGRGSIRSTPVSSTAAAAVARHGDRADLAGFL
jgi:hypothetical protein